jgi:hypothetical protein
MSSEMAALPDLTSDYEVDDADVEAFQRDGHVCLRGVARGDEASAYEEPIRRATLHAADRPPLEERDTYGKAFIQTTNLWRRDETTARFTLSPRFGRIAARLLGVPAVRVYHDQALFKEAGGGPTPWHQDQFYWPLDTDKTITMWMPLVDVTPDMGPLTFASGTQRMGFLGSFAISDESDRVFSDLVEERGLSLVNYQRLAAGDASFHAGWTLHSAPGNDSDRLRSVMTVIYYADGARLIEPDNANRAADLAAWFPGGAPGDLAASPLTPVVG